MLQIQLHVSHEFLVYRGDKKTQLVSPIRSSSYEEDLLTLLLATA